MTPEDPIPNFNSGMKFKFSKQHCLIFIASLLCAQLVGCSSPDSNTPNVKAETKPDVSTKTPVSKSNDEKGSRSEQFAKLQESIHAVAGIATSTKGPEYDFKFELPSDDWLQVSHGAGDKKSSVWLFQLKESGIKVLVSCAGVKESPTFAKSAQMVFDSSVKKKADQTREWKVGNFTLRRSFVGFIDDRHGEVTLSAFSPECTLEFNLASETMDCNDLFKLADEKVEAFLAKNPTGGFPSR